MPRGHSVKASRPKPARAPTQRQQPGRPPMQQQGQPPIQGQGQPPMQRQQPGQKPSRFSKFFGTRKNKQPGQKPSRFSNFFSSRSKATFSNNNNLQSLDYWITEENKIALNKLLKTPPSPPAVVPQQNQAQPYPPQPYSQEQPYPPQPQPYPPQSQPYPPQQQSYPPQQQSYPLQPQSFQQPQQSQKAPKLSGKAGILLSIASAAGIDPAEVANISPGVAPGSSQNQGNGQPQKPRSVPRGRGRRK